MEYEQPIYFIGISLPRDLDAAISELQWLFHESDNSTLKPLLPHVTLLNPPSLRGIMPDELLPKVREIAKKYLPLTLACEVVGHFGKSVSYISVQSHGLSSLQSQLVRLLPPEAQAFHYKRPYQPHITIAQAYDPHRLEQDFIEKETRARLNLPFQFTVDSLSYFKRILPREYRATSV